jgi:hypothetical protein
MDIALVAVKVVDYGSSIDYQNKLTDIAASFSGVSLDCYPVQGQLWNKSRAINTVLKKCKTPFFMVADMDMIFHPEFTKTVLPGLLDDEISYYPVGILTQEESKKELPFQQYKIKFITNSEATGISIFPTKELLEINGFDEFYHGWGSEDTDVHVRMENLGNKVVWKKDTLFFLHQWHPKAYRTKKSRTPYHTGLERVNARYLEHTRYSKKIEANTNRKWGQMEKEQTYLKLMETPLTLELVSTEESVSALCASLVESYKGFASFKITEVRTLSSFRKTLKGIIKKEKAKALPLDKANNQILTTIISRFSDHAYYYSYDPVAREIVLIIKLKI